MAELLLSTDNITVIGGPDIVNLDVDFGPSGTRGSKIFTGVNAPTSLSPAPSGLLGNDQYLATSTGAWYIYDASGSGAWSLQGNIKGPQGLKGDTGATGPTGPSGNVVANELYANMGYEKITADKRELKFTMR